MCKACVLWLPALDVSAQFFSASSNLAHTLMVRTVPHHEWKCIHSAQSSAVLFSALHSDLMRMRFTLVVSGPFRAIDVNRSIIYHVILNLVYQALLVFSEDPGFELNLHMCQALGMRETKPVKAVLNNFESSH
jgi:hypothetical protein